MNPIRERRLERGLTQKQLAHALMVAPRTVRGWELEQYRPSVSMLSQIATVLQCDANDAIWAVEVATDKPKEQLSAEELARREANRERAQPYIERRLALGLKKKDLAEKSGITYETILSLETGKNWPCWETRQKLRRVLGMPEERSYTAEERNALFLEMEDNIHWLTQPPKKMKIMDRNKNVIGSCWQYQLGVDSGKQIIMDNLRVETPGPKFCHFPRRDDYGAAYFKGLLSERLIYDPEKRQHWQWKVIPGHERNEPLDCRNYALAAFETITVDLDAIDRRLQIARGKAVNGTGPAPKVRQRSRVKRSGGIGGRRDEW